MNNSNEQESYPKEFRLPFTAKLIEIIKNFSATEKVLLVLFTTIALISTIYLANNLNNQFLIPIPSKGGEMVEGMIGLPRYINPILAQTDTDRDLNTLIYSGLMKYRDGKIVEDIASSYEISEDGLVYTFKIRDDARFHDGRPVTADDVVFTIQKIQDIDIGSPRRADWSNVTVEAINNKEVRFTIKQPYTPFIVNTTVGILPKHIWQNISNDQFIFSDFNLEPIGTGPYQFKSLKKDENGIPKSYKLKSYNGYHLGTPYISTININFYPNERDAGNAFIDEEIDSISSLSPDEVFHIASSTDKYEISKISLPRIFGVFFNQNKSPVLANKEVRKALNIAVDKNLIIKEVLNGYGVLIDSPIPGSDAENVHNLELASKILSDAGWTINDDTGVLEKKTRNSTQILSFDIYTADTPDLKKATELVVNNWKSLGANVNIKIFEYGDLYQNIIRPRQYDSLLFGEFIGKDLDLYAFWHSSQRNSPGLNLSMYVNQNVDKLLEEVRTAKDEDARIEIYKKIEESIKQDTPAIFIYSPEFIYLSRNIKGIDMESITVPSDRFYEIDKWYIKTEKIWKIFKREQNLTKN